MTLTESIRAARQQLAALDTKIAAKKAERDAHIAANHAVYEKDRLLGREIIALGREAGELRAVLDPKTAAT